MPVCSLCGKKISSTTSFKYHVSHKVCINKSSKQTEQTSKNKLIIKTKQQYANMSRDDLILQLSNMEGKYEALKENPVNNNNIIVFPSSFGNEDMDHIKNILGDILKPMITNHPFQSIPLLFTKIHNNEKLPEYHNVFVNSEHSNYAMVSDGKIFKYKPKKTIIDQIIEEKRSIINQYIDDNGEQLGEKVLNKYEKYQEHLDENSEFRKTLEIEIGGLLLDMKSVIANDEKTRLLLDKVNDGHYEITQ